MNNMKEKYLYYKRKYLQLKELIGGERQIKCDNLEHVGFNNDMGTCWNATILSIFLYGDKTSDITQEKLKEGVDITRLVKSSEEYIYSFLPNSLLNVTEILVELINIVKKRYNVKVNHLQEKHLQLDETMPASAPVLRKEESIQCEIDLPMKFYELFHKEPEFGGNNIDQFFLLNILSIILLETFISTTFYYISNNFSYPLNLKESEVWTTNSTPFDLDLIRESIGVMLGTQEHSIGFFKCSENKFINNNSIINFNWFEFFETLNRLIESLTKYIIILYENELFILYHYKDSESEINEYVKISFTPNGQETVIPEKDFKTTFLQENIITKITILNSTNNISLLVQKNLKYFYLFYLYPDMVKLLENTNNLNCVDEEKETYLMYLIKNKKEGDILNFLHIFPTELNINLINNYNESALFFAIKSNNPKIIEELLKYSGINVDIQDNIKYTPLMRLIKNIQFSNIIKHKLVKKILRCTQNINLKNIYNETALMIACKMNSALCIMAIISHPQINLNLQDSTHGDTALMLLIKNTNIEVAEKIILITKILEFPQEINLKNIYGETALGLAKERYMENVVELLQKHGAQ